MERKCGGTIIPPQLAYLMFVAYHDASGVERFGRVEMRGRAPQLPPPPHLLLRTVACVLKGMYVLVHYRRETYSRKMSEPVSLSVTSGKSIEVSYEVSYLNQRFQYQHHLVDN
jgi:hypothetical protein